MKICAKTIWDEAGKAEPGVCWDLCVYDFRSPIALLTVVQAGRPPADPEPFENMIVILVRI